MSDAAFPVTGEPKREPSLHAGEPSLGQHARDLVWLLAQMYRAAPIHGATWAITALLVGSLAPLQLWAGGRLIDSIEAQHAGRSAASPWLWCAVIAASLSGTRFLDSIRFFADAVVRERSGPAIQACVYRQVTGIDLAAYEHQAFYDTTGRITAELDRTATELLNAFQDTLVSVPRVAGAVFLLAAIDWRLALVILAPLLPNLIGFFRSGKQIWGVLSDQTRNRRIATYFAGRLTDRQAAKEIRLFGIQRLVLDRWSHHFLATRDEIRGKRFRAMLRMQIVGNGSFVVTAVLIGWLLFGGAVDPSAGDVTVLMASFLSIGNWLFNAVSDLQRLGESAGLATDTRAFLALETPHASQRSRTEHREGAGPGHIELVDLRFAYPGASDTVVDGISLTIPPGQRVAIVGENGAGKTTLLKLILGLYAPDGGAVLLDDAPIHELPADERQRRTAAVFQHFTRYPLTVRENITLTQGAQAGDPTVDTVLAMAGLDRVVAGLPDGTSTLLAPDLGGTDLSGGQWQRLAIARAGWRDASILALDEPTAALDPMAEVEIFRRFAVLAEGHTTLLVSHRLGMARLADRILVLEHGRIVEDGTHDDLLDSGGHYAELWRMQARWYR